MAQQTEKLQDIYKTQVNEQFNKLRELVNNREQVLLDEINKSHGKSLNLQFDVDAVKNVCFTFIHFPF